MPCTAERREGSTYGKVRLPNMKVEASLRSQQPRQPHDITIITQCSLDRQAPSCQIHSVDIAFVHRKRCNQCEAAQNRKAFALKPAKGGIPATENIKTVRG